MRKQVCCRWPKGLLQKFDVESLPNYHYIDEKYRNMYFDENNEYCVPYNVGLVGLIYNTKMVEGTPDSWKIMWDEKYAGKILMIDNPRDAFAIPQKIFGYSLNSTDEKELSDVAQMLIDQKPLLQGYVMDEVYNKMESGDAAMVPYYVGDFITMHDVNPDLAFVYPKEGVNFFVDAACILKGAKNKLAAELYINFLLDPEVALANAEYICYASPHTEVYSNPEYTFYQNEILYPEDGKFKTQLFLNLSPEILSLMSTLWDDVKNYVPSSGSSNYAFFFGGDSQSSANTENGEKMTAETRKYAMYIGIFVLICVLYIVFRYARKKYREKV